jgi:hypothetical protein
LMHWKWKKANIRHHGQRGIRLARLMVVNNHFRGKMIVGARRAS